MSRAAIISILAEDQRKTQQNLIHKYLIERGFSHRQIRDIAVPVGETPGISFVRSRFAVEVRSIRVASSNKAIVVGIDADEGFVEDRKRELDGVLRQNGEEERGVAELIAIVVPRRNVETWIWYLEGNSVDETTNYKNAQVRANHDLSEAKRRFADYMITGQEPFPKCPESLRDAREELRRITHR